MRLAKGQEISKGKNIERISERSYIVKSQSGNGSYDVYYTELGFICSCPDHMYRGVKCKHIHAVEFSFALREQVKKEIVISHIDTKLCPQCQSSKIVKHGIRHNRYGDVQRFYCNDCSKWFCFNLGFEKMHATPQIITSAMQLYFTGESFRNVKRFLELQGVKMSHVAVYNWIKNMLD